VWRRLVGRAERERRRHRLLQLRELALRRVEPRAELADQRIELVDQALLERQLHVEIEPALGVSFGISTVGHVGKDSATACRGPASTALQPRDIVELVTDEKPTIPSSNAPDENGGWLKAAVMWSVLIALAVGSGFATGALRIAVGILVFYGAVVSIVLVLYMRSSRRQTLRLTADMNQAGGSLARGELKAAHDVYWECARATKLPYIAAMARHNLAWTLMRQGELQHAIDVATDNIASYPKALGVAGLAATSAVDLALCHGLLGQLDAAEHWMTESKQRTNERSMLCVPAMTAFARAVLDCRAGRSAEAARLLDENWLAYEAVLKGSELRPLRVVRAFAIAASDPRNAGVAETVVASARPCYPGEYDFLAAAWPEMETFLTTHQLKH
jgi:tetratricopeptide (TPR) repeat protein